MSDQTIPMVDEFVIRFLGAPDIAYRQPDENTYEANTQDNSRLIREDGAWIYEGYGCRAVGNADATGYRASKGVYYHDDPADAARDAQRFFLQRKERQAAARAAAEFQAAERKAKLLAPREFTEHEAKLWDWGQRNRLRATVWEYDLAGYSEFSEPWVPVISLYGVRWHHSDQRDGGKTAVIRSTDLTTNDCDSDSLYRAIVDLEDASVVVYADGLVTEIVGYSNIGPTIRSRSLEYDDDLKPLWVGGNDRGKEFRKYRVRLRMPEGEPFPGYEEGED